MKIAQLIAPVHALGPGDRLCIWTQGCHRRCYNCISPEFQDADLPEVPVQSIAKIIMEIAKRENLTRITISGGDPFEQADELEKLLIHIRCYFNDILVYTGFTLEEIKNKVCGDAGLRVLELIDVLIDGPYIEDRNFEGCVLRGSDNQKIHYLNKALCKDYKEYINKGRKMETFSHDGNIVFVGIRNKEKQE